MKGPMASPVSSGPSAPEWIIHERSREAEACLQKELGLPSLVAAVLAQRGYTDPAKAERFLRADVEDLHDPKLLPDYDSAKDAILAAKESGELIYIHGDYDVDGVTSAAILSRFLNRIGCNVHTHVPHRMKEGYGIHLDAVEDARQLGAKLFLTCDCGISAHEQVKAANEAGMKVVVTDHHTVGEELPGAVAVVNPHRSDSQYPFEELSGAGVVFKLCAGLTTELGHKATSFYRGFFDLAALGTIADVMPLVDENRIIARHGLHQLGQTQKVGLQALMREAELEVTPDKPLRSYHVGFVLGPRLNAAGRIDDAGLALRLLLENDPAAAAEIAHQMEEVNAKRKLDQQRMIDEAIEMVLNENLHEKNVIVVGKEGWHSGIVGIVAGRLVEKFNRPTFVMSVDGTTGVFKGSARSIAKFHLAEAIWAHPELFLSGGGHALAAGCSFDGEKLTGVREALDQFAGERLSPEDFLPSVEVDMEVTADEVTLNAAESLAMLEPFGLENPEPTFFARSVNIAQILPTKNPAHVRLVLRQENFPATNGIAFGIGERLSAVGAGANVDLLFQPNVNVWRGSRSLQWQVRDFRVSD